MTQTDLSWHQDTRNGSAPPLCLRNVHINYRTRKGNV